MPWKKSPSSGKFAGRTTEIAEGTEIHGRIVLRGPLLVSGKILGEIASDSTVVVTEKGTVAANISAVAVHVSGEVDGDVVATERVELREKCRVYGDVSAPVVIIAEGALFEGQCRMTKERPADAHQPVRDPSVVPLKQRADLPR